MPRTASRGLSADQTPRWWSTGRGALRVAGIVLLAVVAPVVVIAGFVWGPVLAHYHVDPAPSVSREVIAASRQQPADRRFDEIRELTFGIPETDGYDDRTLVRAAEGILGGRFELPGWETREIGVPFDPADLEKGSGVWPLRYASLMVPKVLIDAYERSGRDEFLLGARDFLLAWGSFERSIWLPKGYIWNDHAVAARVPTLSDFWRWYRSHPGFRQEDARRFLELVALTGRRLADPDHYTFATNHGTFQTLALFHLVLSFPGLPGFDDFLAIARERLTEQMAYLVAPDGVVLEHSAEYHRSGLERLTMAFRYLTLADLPVPDSWRERYGMGLVLYDSLIRPDGTLPRVGDTKVGTALQGMLVTSVDETGRAGELVNHRSTKYRERHGLYPVGGYSLWWSGSPDTARRAQTVVGWSHYPGHAHKHADELAVNVWAGGVEWLTQAGYWPYGEPGRDWAISWQSSNAPHLLGESADSQRESSLLGYSFTDGLFAVEMERRREDGFAVRRQVIEARQGLWLILDAYRDPQRRTAETVWTLDPSITLAPADDGSAFRLSVSGSSLHAGLRLLGAPGSRIDVYEGSRDPRLGWSVDADNEVQPAAAVVLRQPAVSWSAAVLRLGDSIPAVDTADWRSPEHWLFEIGTERDGTVLVSRSGSRIAVRADGKAGVTAAAGLQPPPDVAGQRQAIRAAFAEAGAKYGEKFNPRFERRTKLSVLLLAMFGVQEMVLLAWWRLIRFGYYILRTAAVTGWMVGGIGLWAVFL